MERCLEKEHGRTACGQNHAGLVWVCGVVLHRCGPIMNSAVAPMGVFVEHSTMRSQQALFVNAQRLMQLVTMTSAVHW